ncbi:unnamed protein product [Moneuplotes crassus]|uniref:Uncharacterized protein n=1 Tax=Euplotes crassus TaxID=5936 RepID=A0AAD1XD28_EUPCR|nr:unnamed protein product [Moneuplotes crassus]
MKVKHNLLLKNIAPPPLNNDLSNDLRNTTFLIHRKIQKKPKITPVRERSLKPLDSGKLKKICRTRRTLNKDLLEVKDSEEKKTQVKNIPKKKVTQMARTTNSRSPNIPPLKRPSGVTTDRSPRNGKSLESNSSQSKFLEICASDVIKEADNNFSNFQKYTRNLKKIPHFSKFDKFLCKAKPDFTPGTNTQEQELKLKYRNYEFSPRIFNKSVNQYPLNAPPIEGLTASPSMNIQKPVQSLYKMKLSKSFEMAHNISTERENARYWKRLVNNISNVYVTSLQNNVSVQNQRNALFNQLNRGEVKMPTLKENSTHHKSTNESILSSLDKQIHSKFAGTRKVAEKITKKNTNDSKKPFKLKKGEKFKRNIRLMLDKLIQSSKEENGTKNDYKKVFENAILRNR